jgi:hypothetical protein
MSRTLERSGPGLIPLFFRRQLCACDTLLFVPALH